MDRKIFWFAVPQNERPRCTDNDVARWNNDKQPVYIETSFSNGTARVRPHGSTKTFVVEQSELHPTQAAAEAVRA